MLHLTSWHIWRLQSITIESELNNRQVKSVYWRKQLKLVQHSHSWDHTIFPTPGDPTNMVLSTEDTSASPVSAKLSNRNLIRCIETKSILYPNSWDKYIPCNYLNQIFRSSNSSKSCLDYPKVETSGPACMFRNLHLQPYSFLST